jgi:tyrosyl-tRNA synthetase
MAKFVDFSDGKALMLNNADWLLKLNYVELLREVGAHFSVNNMLRAECYKQRMERGLSFLEFNYMIMQSYDFYHMFKEYGCVMQCGGDDQWSNILGGTELIRRKLGKDAYGMTITLLLTSEGKKMGKTAKGAVWLDPRRLAPTSSISTGATSTMRTLSSVCGCSHSCPWSRSMRWPGGRGRNSTGPRRSCL